MRTIRAAVVLATALAASTAATGCIIIDDDDGDDRGDGGDDDPLPPPPRTEFEATWLLLSGDEVARCRPDTTSVTLYACRGVCDLDGPRPPDLYADVSTCSDVDSEGSISVPRAGRLDEALRPGDYTVWIELAAGDDVYAKSFAEQITLVEDEFFSKAFDIQVDHGFFDVAWTLVDGSQAVSCEIAGVTDVELTPSGCADQVDCAVNLEPDNFVCGPGSGLGSIPYPFYDYGYAISLIAFDASNAALGGSDVVEAPPFEYGNQGRNLGTVVVELD